MSEPRWLGEVAMFADEEDAAPFGIADLARALRISRAAAGVRLVRATQAGVTKRIGRGRYQLALTKEGG